MLCWFRSSCWGCKHFVDSYLPKISCAQMTFKPFSNRPAFTHWPLYKVLTLLLCSTVPSEVISKSSFRLTAELSRRNFTSPPWTYTFTVRPHSSPVYIMAHVQQCASCSFGQGHGGLRWWIFCPEWCQGPCWLSYPFVRTSQCLLCTRLYLSLWAFIWKVN